MSGGILWCVSVFEGGLSQERYWQLARFQNHYHSPKCNIQLTFLGDLSNMRKS